MATIEQFPQPPQKTTLQDSAGTSLNKVAMGGATITGDYFRLCGGTFGGSVIDASQWTPTLATGGTAVVGGGEISLAASTSSGSSSIVQSTVRAQYQAGNANNFQAVVRTIDSGVANNVRRWGCFDANNGAFFELSGTTFQIVTRKAGVNTAVTIASWDSQQGVATPFVFDGNVHSYGIQFSTRSIVFEIDGVRMHTVSSSTSPVFADYHFPARMENTNTGASTASSLCLRAAALQRIGAAAGAVQWFNMASAGLLAGGNAQVFTRPGVVKGFLVNSGPTAGTLSMYDSVGTATNPIGVFNLTLSNRAVYFPDPGLQLSNGLYVVYTGVLGTGDVTIYYS